MKPISTMSTADLLGVVLGSQAAERLSELSSLRPLQRAAVSELTQLYGLSECAARKAAAVTELVHRIDASPVERGQRLASSAAIAEHARALGMTELPVEQFRVLLLGAKNRLLDDVLCSQGILTASLVHPREVFEPAIRARAAAIVLVHNHPSGEPEPSPEDHEVTARLCAVGELVGIKVADHVIVAREGYVSFLERGLIPS